jgi:hypothetical protein
MYLHNPYTFFRSRDRIRLGICISVASNGPLYILQTINELKGNTGGMRIDRENYKKEKSMRQ